MLLCHFLHSLAQSLPDPERSAGIMGRLGNLPEPSLGGMTHGGGLSVSAAHSGLPVAHPIFRCKHTRLHMVLSSAVLSRRHYCLCGAPSTNVTFVSYALGGFLVDVGESKKATVFHREGQI